MACSPDRRASAARAESLLNSAKETTWALSWACAEIPTPKSIVAIASRHATNLTLGCILPPSRTCVLHKPGRPSHSEPESKMKTFLELKPATPGPTPSLNKQSGLLESDKNLNHTLAFAQRFQRFAHNGTQHPAPVGAFHGVAWGG